MGVLRIMGAAAALAAAAGAAQAHVSVTPAAAAPGSYQVLRFGVGHGCDGKATTALRIEVPAGVASARPQPKPGWTLTIDRVAGGEQVRAITWRGELPADQFDEFLVQVHFPSTAGALAFPAEQTCGATQVRWAEPTPPGGPRPKQPAPTVTLTPPPTDGAAPHRH